MKLFKWLKTISIGLWCLALLIVGCWLVVDNPIGVKPRVMGFILPELSLGFYVCFSVLIGVVLGFISSYLVTEARLFGKKRELRRAQKEVKSLQSSQLSG